MRFTPACSSRRNLLTFLVACITATTALGKGDWEPIPPEDLAATECVSHPGASAEALFIRQSFDSGHLDAWTTHFQRFKIYSPKSAEEIGVMNIDYAEDQRIWDLAARVTKPNGSSAEYEKEDFHESIVAKTHRYKLKRQTLAVPNLEAGDVVELKWSQAAPTDAGSYYWRYCQLPVPVRQYTFSVEGSQTGYRVFWYNVKNAELTSPNGRQMQLQIKNLPPFNEEPAMAPMRDVRGWFLIMFTSQYMNWFNKNESGWWREVSTYYADEYRLLTKPNSEIKRTAMATIQGTTSDDEKLQRLYDFSRKQISNLDYLDSADLQKAKKKLKERRSAQYPGETLKEASGYSHHVNELFASLARAAGFEVRQARSATRTATLTVQNPMGWVFLHEDAVAVHRGQAWTLYAPGDYYVPAGMLKSPLELATSLICDPKEIIFEKNPVSPAQKSPVKRKGKFTLDADGNLEGEVEISMDGHSAITHKMNWQEWQATEIDKEYRKQLTTRLPSAEVGDLDWENLEGTSLPLVVRHRMMIPGYADIAGDKIIFAPGVFEHGSTAFFTSENRQHPIFFDHAWSESDDIEITLPDGYSLDAASAPTDVGDLTGTVGVKYGITYKGKTRTLGYRREFALGANGVIALQTPSYPALKELFDSIHRSDEHTIVLKPKTAVSAATTATSPNTAP